jgi:Methyltransferase domain
MRVERAWSAFQRRVSPLAKWVYSRHRRRFDSALSFTEAARYYRDRNELYAYMHHYFHHLAPAQLRQHRAFFSVQGRGFGEDALHAMWWLLLEEFKPESCLEIGVFRGQVISLWTAIAGIVGYSCDVHGISPFSALSDQVSRYSDAIDYHADVLSFFEHFQLQRPTLVRALSSDPEAIRHISSRKWDLMYIDGGHDYETVVADYRVCTNSLAEGGLLVLDDSSLYTSFRAPSFSFAGHPGPSKVMLDYAMHELTFLGGVGHNNVFSKGTRRA